MVSNTTSIREPAGTKSISLFRSSSPTLIIASAAIATAIFSLPVEAARLKTILNDVPVSGSQVFTQQTPIAVSKGHVVVTQIEPGSKGDTNGIDLLTVVRSGYPTGSGWQWQSSIIDESTAYNPWHTVPSIGFDPEGRIHVAYNMHNMPWQYKVSTAPYSIENFEFRGQPISRREIARAKFENKTSFPTSGTADIPGNQISYPAFYNDPNGELYVTYRYAAKPARSFPQRTMAAGIARYDALLKEWKAIGGPLALSPGDARGLPGEHSPSESLAFAAKTGWTAYHPRLSFAADGRVNTTLFWRSGIAGAQLIKPCFVKQHASGEITNAENTPLTLPITPDKCGNMQTPGSRSYYSSGNMVANSDGDPYMILSPLFQSREIIYLKNGVWKREPSPGNATELFFDANDALWAIGSGLRVYRRATDNAPWETIISPNSKQDCFPRAALNQARTVAYIYTKACYEKTASVHELSLD